LAGSVSDKELAGRLRDRDAAALTEWVDRYGDGVYGFAFYRVGRDPDLAAEVTQETFTRALQQLKKFDPSRGPMLAWLCTLSRNCIRDTLRHRGHQPLAALWDSIDNSLQRAYGALDSSPLAPDIVEARETRELVGVTLTQLPVVYRAVLRAKYMEDKSLQQIAQDRSSTVDAVKGLLKRARSAFRQTFATLAGTAAHLGELGG
jgi:RNA polymerase sigma-70 factor, ECF subfamily